MRTLRRDKVLQATAEGVCVPAAIKRCIAPFSYTQRFYVSVFSKPVFLAIALVLAMPIWNLLRTLLPAQLWAKLQAPPVIRPVHMYRGLVNVFLALFAPLTRASLEMLFCKSTCDECADVYTDGTTHPSCKVCRVVNVVDTSVECWTGDHVAAAAAAAVNLALYTIVCPMMLLRLVRKSQRRREALLAARACDADATFDDIIRRRRRDDETARPADGLDAGELEAFLGLGRIVALHRRSSTLY